MKKRPILSLLCLLCAICASAQLKMDGVNIDPGVISGLDVEWPEIDADGEDITSQALIVVTYEFLKPEDIKRFTIDVTDIVPNRVKTVQNDNGEVFTLVFLPLKAKDKYLNVKPQKTEGVRTRIPEMQDKGIYSTKVSDTRRVDIQVAPLVDNPNTQVWLDNNQHYTVPATFTDVTLGTHKLSFRGVGDTPVERIIDVTMQDNKFTAETHPDFDLRKRRAVLIESETRNSTVYVDGVLVSDKAPVTVNLPAGEYTIKVVSNADPLSSAQQTVKISLDGQLPKVHLRPRYTSTFTVSALLNHQSMPFELYVNGKENQEIEGGDHQTGLNPQYTFTLPVGRKYKFKATYGGYSGNKKISVKRGMPQNIAIDMKKRRQFVWPWEREYDEAPLGLEVGWVRKQFRVSANGEEIYKGKLIFIETGDGQDEWMNGVRAGIHFQPTFWKGIGLYTGLFWECYLASTDAYKTDNGYTSYFSKYEEHNLYLPIHLFYEIPLARKIAINLHGGIGLNYCLQRKMYDYKYEVDNVEYDISYNILKDDDNYFPEFPDAFSASWEVGVQLRLGPIILGAELMNPLTKHKFELDGIKYETKMYRQAFTLSYVFNGSAFH